MPEGRTTHFATGAPASRIARPRAWDDPEMGRRILEREHELATLADAGRGPAAGRLVRRPGDAELDPRRRSAAASR
jgi:hypothetical protein